MVALVFSADLLTLDKTNLVAHWDAMNSTSMVVDPAGKIAIWVDSVNQYDVKAPAANRPLFVANAINNFPAIDFTGSNIGLISDIKYSVGPNNPFTWIMAVKPTAGNGWTNIFTTSDNNWDGLNGGNPYEYYPISAASDGIHGWSTPNDLRNNDLSDDTLTIYTIWYDGNTAKIYWGNSMKAEITPTSWDRGPIGYVAMGFGVQNEGHDYFGYIGEVLAYDTALGTNALNIMITAMTTKWTSGKLWEEAGMC